MEVILYRDKITKNGIFRYMESAPSHPMSIYLTPERVAELGEPVAIKVAISKDS